MEANIVIPTFAVLVSVILLWMAFFAARKSQDWAIDAKHSAATAQKIASTLMQQALEAGAISEPWVKKPPASKPRARKHVGSNK